MTSKQQTASSSSSLYGIQRSKQSASKKDLTSSSTLAFTTHLSSLISKDAAATTQSSSSSGRGRTRPSKGSKPDIFAVHNKGALKRAAADEAEDVHGALRQVHQSSDIVGQVDAATLQRSRRRMEEKAHIYEDLKKGYHLAEGESSDEDDDVAAGDSRVSKMRRRERNALVDFDRKWAEQEQNEDEDGDDDEETGSMVDYEDEFGRTRRGTKAEAAQAARARRQLENDEAVDETSKSRPARPSNLIHGEAIQSQAFNPDAAMASQMAALAARRDRSATPPEQAHYDAEAEVRTRGTGFYKFSADEKTREREMEELLKTRRETEREREVRGERKAERDRLKEERRRKVHELRSKHHAERFLKGLSVDLG
ncbi:hypothetical protein PISL3812_02996 [Talaromyces islandicus]|uniref:Coiled-coil domain-containing protein 174 n=1 Tax=Talaromyces islandicus TaxID=28573 RepID=A0A0U1LRF8_TALIS|nr:hypothetical protein PISL3812_02996 [Talaromyces islandicus]